MIQGSSSLLYSNLLSIDIAFSTLTGTAVSGAFKPFFPLVAMATWHKPTCLASARKPRTLDSARLAVGHGRVIDHPGTAMDKAIETMARASGQRAQSQATAG